MVSNFFSGYLWLTINITAEAAEKTHSPDSYRGWQRNALYILGNAFAGVASIREGEGVWLQPPADNKYYRRDRGENTQPDSYHGSQRNALYILGNVFAGSCYAVEVESLRRIINITAKHAERTRRASQRNAMVILGSVFAEAATQLRWQ